MGPRCRPRAGHNDRSAGDGGSVGPMSFTRGRLLDPDAAPAAGETIHRLAGLDGVVIDQILSGRLDGPVDYFQDEDEWVVVLHGRATLDVEDERLYLEPGDWVLIPARTPHRLVETATGTNWLTVTATPPALPPA
jgi:mannose-6-phosphate isomerase-like protein (cupin superfamily)